MEADVRRLLTHHLANKILLVTRENSASYRLSHLTPGRDLHTCDGAGAVARDIGPFKVRINRRRSGLMMNPAALT